MRNLSDCSGMIFDLDGTLLDSLGVWEQVDIAFLSKRGLPILPDYAQQIAHMGFPAAAQYTIDRFSLPETPQMLMDEWFHLAAEAYRTRVPLKPGAREFLHQIHAQGVHIAAATSSELTLILPCLERLGIADFFENITTIREVTRDKASPDIYLLAAARMGLQPKDCAVFEDILRGIRSAKSAGFYTVAVEEPASSAEKPELVQTAAQYIHSYIELIHK